MITSIFSVIIQYSISVLCYLLAYIISVTIAGAFTAWVSKKCGDATAEYAGFLTLDPVAHIDPIGMVMLIVFNFGWGRDVPLDISEIRSPLRDLKILLAYYSSMIMHLLLIIATFIGLIAVSIAAFNSGFLTSLGTYAKTLGLFLQVFIRLNCGLALLRFLQASVDLVFIPLKIDDEQTVRIVSLLITLLLLYTLGDQIQGFFYTMSLHAAAAIVGLFS